MVALERGGDRLAILVVVVVLAVNMMDRSMNANNPLDPLIYRSNYHYMHCHSPAAFAFSVAEGSRPARMGVANLRRKLDTSPVQIGRKQKIRIKIDDNGRSTRTTTTHQQTQGGQGWHEAAAEDDGTHALDSGGGWHAQPRSAAQ